MTTHQVKYSGPPSLAVRVATLLADAEGIELRSADKEEGAGPSGETAVLTLTVEGTIEAVTAAVGSIGAELPDEASVTMEHRPEPS